MPDLHYCAANRGRQTAGCVSCGVCSACGLRPTMPVYGKCIGCGVVRADPLKKPVVEVSVRTPS